MLRTLLQEQPAFKFTEDDLAEFADVILDCYNGAAGNPLIIFFMKRCSVSCRDIDADFRFYTALKRWSHQPFSIKLYRSNIDRYHWIELYRLYMSNKYKRRRTKLKKMFQYIAGIKLD